MQAQAGDRIEIGRPQGSYIVADDFDWYLLVGDETGLPAVARPLEELRERVPVRVLAAVDIPEDRLKLLSRATVTEHWTCRSEGGSDSDRLIGLIDSLPKLPGDGYVWIACEASVAQALRTHLLVELGHPREWVKAAGYWTRGVADVHEQITD